MSYEEKELCELFGIKFYATVSEANAVFTSVEKHPDYLPFMEWQDILMYSTYNVDNQFAITRTRENLSRKQNLRIAVRKAISCL